jgi:hypothetical protein
MGARSSVPPRARSSARLGWTKNTLRRYQFKLLNKTGEASLTYIVFMNSSVSALGFRWYIIQSIILLYIEYRFELRLLKERRCSIGGSVISNICDKAGYHIWYFQHPFRSHPVPCKRQKILGLEIGLKKY